jgi:acetyl-CoA carboxylase biotin carboxyl carrier protein
MDLGMIRKLVRLMESADLSELEIDDTAGGMRVHLCRGGGKSQGGPQVLQLMPGAGAPMMAAMPAAAGSAGGQGGPALGAGPSGDAGAAGGGHAPGTVPFPSPMVGTFYRAASPDADPFVAVGSAIDDDTTICIIEAMKVMNEVKAETKGEIVDVLVENGEPVEFGQPLFLIKPR